MIRTICLAFVVALVAPEAAFAKGSRGRGHTRVSGHRHRHHATSRIHHSSRRRCQSESKVVGRDQCRRFGDWSTITSVPAITADLGVRARSLLLSPWPIAGSGLAYQAATAYPTDGRLQTFGPALGLSIGSRWHAGLELEGGITPVSAPGALQGGYGQASVPIGYRGRSGPWLFVVEAAPAVRFTSRFLPGSRSHTTTDPVLEARARVDLMLSPWWSVGVIVGADVNAFGSWMVGLTVTGHIRAYDALSP